MAQRQKKFSPDHPFSLQTLIQSSKTPALSRKEDEKLEDQEICETDDCGDYRPPSHYQAVAADLSVDPPPSPQCVLFPPCLQLPPRLPQLPTYEFYPSGGGDYPGEELEPRTQEGEDHQYSEYGDYYPRLPYNYSESSTIQVPERQQQYDYSVKVDDSSYPGPGLVLPPLHPSPAVLLHIQYVMESVCEAMSITDLTIITATDTLRAHRSILSAHSAFLASLLSSQDSDSDLVLYFPHHSSLVVRMLLQFFYTGEVSTMTQADIEPLKQICLDLGITALMERLEDLNLSISFQKQSQTKSIFTVVNTHIPVYGPAEEDEDEPASCKFQQQTEKQKISTPKCVFSENQPRQYTVVSKMPKDTKLQVSVKCSKCDLKFFKPEILEEHLKLHAGKKAKQCGVCKKTFNSNYHFKTHMRTHTRIKPYCCAVKDCQKEFVDSSSLRRHQSIHSGERGFKCNICGKCFTDRSSKKRHEDAHSNPYLIACPVCSKKFTRNSQLKKHMGKLHSNMTVNSPENKPDISTLSIEECPECKAVFKRPSKLVQHMRVHSGVKPFHCNECDKSFARKTNLVLHKRTHTGEKPHACARCGRCFSDVSAFRRHCRTHTGERPYTCEYCTAAFTQASTLYNHKKTCKRKRFNSMETEVEKLKDKCLNMSVDV